jgi:hypothetical protein
MVLLVPDCRLGCRHYCRQLVAVPGPTFVTVLLIAMPGW